MNPLTQHLINSEKTSMPSDDGSQQNYVPIVLSLGGKELDLLPDKPVLDQLNQDTSRGETKVKVSYKNGKVVLEKAHYGGIPFHVPEKMPTTFDITNLKGNVGYGVFSLLLNDEGKILFVHKRRGKVWYIPGGLLEQGDSSRGKACTREVIEETGVEAPEGYPIYLYESAIPSPEKPRRHNLMEVRFARYKGSDENCFKESDEIDQCEWMTPLFFLSSSLKNPKFTTPSMRIALRYLRDMQMKEAFRSSSWDSEMQEKYYHHKKLQEDIDELLFDFCFLEVEMKFSSNSDFFSLVDSIRKLAKENS